MNSLESLKCLPIGTRLYLVRTLSGPCEPAMRTIVNIDDRDIVLATEGGKVTYLSFMPGMKIESTMSGFLVRESLVQDTRGKIVAQYIVELA